MGARAVGAGAVGEKSQGQNENQNQNGDQEAVSLLSPSSSQITPPVTEKPILATPATRRLARELGVSLNDMVGSGLAGRITYEDVLRKGGQNSTQGQQQAVSRESGWQQSSPSPSFGLKRKFNPNPPKRKFNLNPNLAQLQLHLIVGSLWAMVCLPLLLKTGISFKWKSESPLGV